ncbi:MAG: type I glutamate--ammonia ligase [Gammaproteobacteria bacterium RIFCSPHIGHO2_02_FULL_42_13]|nr:MAG: type I glutamate--ammonia ligase [Gammaproteobacteria bacterium RIFCSPHIGHO2_02_FULL_42_13]
MITRDEILNLLKSEHVSYLRLCFTDIMGISKNVEIPASQFPRALDGQVLFDGSSIEGFARIEESDMVLVPDYNTFHLLPWDNHGGHKIARIICDIANTNGSAFVGCPRSALKHICNKAKHMGYTPKMGPEAEFFLFERGEHGQATTRTHDSGSYFDLTPIDRGEETRRAIVQTLEKLNFEVEAAHHEVAHGQHEIDFKYGDVLDTADKIVTFRFVVRKVALDFGLHATFMPKPIYGINGSGMHTHQSLFIDDNNAFHDPNDPIELSKIARHYIAGLLHHVPCFCAITNPLVNSYKRLVPGYEAPTHIVWSLRNRSPLLRIPDRRGSGTRAELRSPDPACNPYLAFAVMLAAGLDGIENKMDPGEPVNKNIYNMSGRERARLKIKSLPSDLDKAIDEMEKSELVKNALGEHIFQHFITAKRREWQKYIAQVHPWEIEQYLTTY